MSIDNVQITEFNAQLDVQEQQMNTRLLPFVVRVPVSGDNFAYDGITEVSSYRANGRSPLVQPTQASFTRRKMSRERIVVSLEVDDRDVRGMLSDPKGDLAKLCIAAIERETDRIIYDAMFASVLTGRNFETTVNYTTDGVISVDATAAMTYEKLLEIRANFIDNEVSNESSPIPVVIGISGDEHTDLMSEVELTSGDFTKQYNIDKGIIKEALGMGLVPFGAGSNVTDPILETVGGERISFALSKNGVALGISLDRKVEVKDVPGKIETTLINVIKEVGAVRTQGVRIQRVRLTP
ncbi:MAG: phage capsid protein [Patescibacteria group bacterium]